LDPFNADAWVHSGAGNYASLDFNQAFGAFSHAVVLNPANSKSLHHRGKALEQLGMFLSSEREFSRAVIAAPNAYEAMFGLAQINLRRLDLPSGWNWYERRWQADSLFDGTPRPLYLRTSRPRVSSLSECSGRRVLVWAEQGVGDEVMFGTML
jgi:tetratricopeptide (TPR) repeat protein